MFRVHRQSEQPHLHSSLLVTGNHTQTKRTIITPPPFSDKCPKNTDRGTVKKDNRYETQLWAAGLEERCFSVIFRVVGGKHFSLNVQTQDL